MYVGPHFQHGSQLFCFHREQFFPYWKSTHEVIKRTHLFPEHRNRCCVRYDFVNWKANIITWYYRSASPSRRLSSHAYLFRSRASNIRHLKFFLYSFYFLIYPINTHSVNISEVVVVSESLSVNTYTDFLYT